MHSPAPSPWTHIYPKDVDWHAPLHPRPLPELLAQSVRLFADKPCLDFFGRITRYRALGAQVEAAAAGLQNLGVQKGMRVGLFLPNSPAYVIFFFAILRAGGIVVNINPLYAEKEIAHEIEDADVALLISVDLPVLIRKLDPALAAGVLQRVVLVRMQDMLPAPKSLLYPLVRAKDVFAPGADTRFIPAARLLADTTPVRSVEIHPDDIAVLQYTGGTTGTPKGAMLTHGNLSANVRQSRLWFHPARDGQETMLAVLPLFHVFAMTTILNLGLAIGAKLILLPKFDLHEVIRTIHTKRPTLFPAVPTIYTAINNFAGLAKYDLSSIRYCISGGAPLPAEVKKSFEALTGCTLVEGYGLTESSPVVSCNPLTGENKPGSIGLPLPGTHIEIVSLEDGTTLLPAGQRGEVCIRGPQVMRGYWNQPEETAGVLKNGRLHTGDAGLMDDQGYIFITDRIKDMILAGGYNVYPRMVEEAIYQHPGVAECAVGGVPDEYRGQTVKAWIRMKDGQTLDAAGLDAFLKDKLSPIERPKRVEFRTAPLPKTPIGKVSRKMLLEEEAGPDRA